MCAPGSVGSCLRCFLPGASTLPPLRPLFSPRAGAAAGFFFEPFVAPSANCLRRWAALGVLVPSFVRLVPVSRFDMRTPSGDVRSLCECTAGDRDNPETGEGGAHELVVRHRQPAEQTRRVCALSSLVNAPVSCIDPVFDRLSWTIEAGSVRVAKPTMAVQLDDEPCSPSLDARRLVREMQQPDDRPDCAVRPRIEARGREPWDAI